MTWKAPSPKGVLNFKYVQNFDNRWDLLVKGSGPAGQPQPGQQRRYLPGRR
jgi:hypothetical protein